MSPNIVSPLSPEDQARLTAIYARSVEKMKEVVHEFAITQAELHLAGDYINRLGQSGFGRSLMAVTLAMTSIDATQPADGGTRPNLEGPFHRSHPERPDGDLIDTPPPGQPRLILSGVVSDARTGAPLPGAWLDFWQADNEGHYDHDGFNLCGRVTTDDLGGYRVRTVVPRDYSDHDHDPIGELFRAMGRHNRRAAHIHVKAGVGETEALTTQLFIAGSPYLDSDYVEGAVSDDLIVTLEQVENADDGAPVFSARFDIALDLQG